MNHALLIFTLCFAGISASLGAQRGTPASPRGLDGRQPWQLGMEHFMMSAFNLQCIPTPINWVEESIAAQAVADFDVQRGSLFPLLHPLDVPANGSATPLGIAGYLADGSTHTYEIYAVKESGGTFYINPIPQIVTYTDPNDASSYGVHVGQTAGMANQTHILIKKTAGPESGGFYFNTISGLGQYINDTSITDWDDSDPATEIGYVVSPVSGVATTTDGARIARVRHGAAGQYDWDLLPALGVATKRCPVLVSQAFYTGYVYYPGLRLTMADNNGLFAPAGITLGTDYTVCVVFLTEATSAGQNTRLIDASDGWRLGPRQGVLEFQDGNHQFTTDADVPGEIVPSRLQVLIATGDSGATALYKSVLAGVAATLVGTSGSGGSTPGRPGLGATVAGVGLSDIAASVVAARILFFDRALGAAEAVGLAGEMQAQYGNRTVSPP